MKVIPIHTGNFKLDGGAMFGVVPKSLWERTNPADERNLCNWAMRCLLIDTGSRVILIDNGIGDKQDVQFMGHYFLNGDQSLLGSLQANGYSFEDITDVLLTHLHFDHCGGGVIFNASSNEYQLRFPKARYWVNEVQWRWAVNPNAREKASFLKENIMPMQESGQLVLMDAPERFSDEIALLYANGHTDGMTLPKFEYKGRTIVYMADLLPSTGHIPLPYVMGYDTRPLLTIEEKKYYFDRAIDEEWVFFLEHDPKNECCTITKNEKGNYSLKEAFPLSAL
jgi:glyoxylase-like metal-dependent hydrolase (beta-lactamase superfamily II)